MFIVQIAGRLGKDPETRYTPSGQKVTTFNLAINQRKGKEEVTTWVRVTTWGDRFDKLFPYLKKGSGVIVVGKMNPPSNYVDREGKSQFSLEVTAEMVEFNPFGGTGERSTTDGVSTSSSSAVSQFQTEYPQSSYNASMSGANSASRGNFEGSPFGTSMGQGQTDKDSGDLDPFPF